MSAVELGLARTGIEVRQFFRERDSMVFTFAFPVILLFIFGSVFQGQTITDPGVQPAVDFTQYFTAGMIASGVVLSSFQSLAIGIAIERDDGTLKRLHGTPMPPSAYFLGKIGLVLVTSVVQTAVLLPLRAPCCSGWTCRHRPSSGCASPGSSCWARPPEPFWALPSRRSPGPRAAPRAVVSPVVIVLQFISGIFFVLNQLPTWMVYVGSVFPLRWLAQGMRSVFLPESFGLDGGGRLVAAAADRPGARGLDRGGVGPVPANLPLGLVVTPADTSEPTACDAAPTGVWSTMIVAAGTTRSGCDRSRAGQRGVAVRPVGDASAGSLPARSSGSASPTRRCGRTWRTGAPRAASATSPWPWS